MTSLVAAIQPYLEHFGYPLLFFIVLIESFGVPAPGQTLLITTALLAAAGKLNIVAVLLTAFAAAITGDTIGYVIGARGGRRLLLRYGRHIGLTRRRYRKLHLRFNRHGIWFVLFARFFDFLRQVNGLLAGSVDMPFMRFVLFNNIGAVLWVSLWGLGAYFIGRGLNRWVSRYETAVTWVVMALVAISLASAVVWVLRRWHRRRTSGEG